MSCASLSAGSLVKLGHWKERWRAGGDVGSHSGAICSLMQTARLSGQARKNDWGSPTTEPRERGLWTHEVIPPVMYGPEKSWVNDLLQDPGVKHSNFIIPRVMD